MMELSCVVRREVKLLSRRRCYFSDAVLKPSCFVDILPDPKVAANFTIAKSKEIGVQCEACNISALKINTVSASTDNRGLNHKEGGWPRDVNPQEPDQTARYRKKIEKDESYSQTVLALGQQMEHYIKQNNVFNIYEDYFMDAPDVATPDLNPLRTLHVLKDASTRSRARPVTCISWSPDGGVRLAAAYSDPIWTNLFSDSKDNDSFIWNIERTIQPEVVLRSTSQLRCVSFNPRDQHVLAGGTVYGSVGIWDVRKSQGPVECVPLDTGHREAVTSLIWSNSKAGGEFFSAAADGQILWWDMRKMTAPIDTMILDSNSVNPPRLDTMAASCLEYDPSMPNKFLVGTQQGLVLSCNRRARTPAERIMGQYDAHIGAVHALHRHPQMPKIFLTVGDWATHIWTEDIRDSPILTLKNQHVQLLTGSWSYTRPSVIFTAATDGALYLWDVLASRSAPTLCSQVSESALLSLSTQEQGKILAVGSEDGCVSVIQISDILSTVTRNDKTALTSLLERETRREKTLEQRKDMKGKQAMKAINTNQQPVPVITPQTPNSATRRQALQIGNEEAVVEQQQQPPGSPRMMIEPSADQMAAQFNLVPPANNSSALAVTEPTVDEHLHSAEEAFFDIINQDIMTRRGNAALLLPSE